MHKKIEQHDDNEVGADDDEQRQERAQLGYLNALSELTAAGAGDSSQPTVRASSDLKELASIIEPIMPEIKLFQGFLQE